MIVADDENLDLAEEYGFVGLERPNDELGRKFNDGIEYACRELEADYVVHIGSDNWTHESLFDRMPDPSPPMVDPEPGDTVVWRDAPEVITGRRLCVVDMEQGGMTRLTVRGRSGVVPWILPRRALEPSGFRPVRDSMNRLIDFSLMSGLGVRPSLVFVDPHDCARVDFKTSENLTSMDLAMSREATELEDPWVPLSELYPWKLVEMAKAAMLAVAA